MNHRGDEAGGYGSDEGHGELEGLLESNINVSTLLSSLCDTLYGDKEVLLSDTPVSSLIIVFDAVVAE